MEDVHQWILPLELSQLKQEDSHCLILWTSRFITGSLLLLYLRHNGIQLEESYSASLCGTETEHIEEMFSSNYLSPFHIYPF